MAISREQIQQIIGEGLSELATQGVLDITEIQSIINAVSNPLVETFEAQAGLSGLPVRTFTEFNPLSDVVSNVKSKVSSPLWTDIAGTGKTGTLTAFYTNSAADGFTVPADPTLSDTLPYYMNVYDENPDVAATTASAQSNFAIAYGHKDGNGIWNNSESTYKFQYPTRAIYSQYQGLLIGYNDPKFTVDGGDIDDIIVFNINRARIKEKLDPGNWQITLQEPGADSSHSLELIDDSGQGLSAFGGANNTLAGGGSRVFQVVSGSINMSDDHADFGKKVGDQVYGLVYPDAGIILLDPAKITAAHSNASGTAGGGVGLTMYRTALSSESDGANNLTNLANLFNSLKSGSFFRARSEEEVTSTHYFCRIQNRDYNFSNNPTYFTSSDGSFTNAAFFKDPKSYITTVGLYNDNNELLAVAKLSKPLLKDFSREAVIKVKLDF